MGINTKYRCDKAKRKIKNLPSVFRWKQHTIASKLISALSQIRRAQLATSVPVLPVVYNHPESQQNKNNYEKNPFISVDVEGTHTHTHFHLFVRRLENINRKKELLY
jgi:hypothetical protein